MAKQEVGFTKSVMFVGRMPALCEMKDRFDNTIHFGNAGDYWSPPFPIGADTDYWTHNQNIRNLEIRDDDVLMTGFPKTGTNWHNEIVRMLMSGEAKYEEQMAGKHFGILDMMPAQRINALQSPRLLGLHTPFRHIPRQALEKKVKIVYLDRNPKDVFVSYYNHMHGHLKPLHYPGTFEHFCHLMLESGYYYGDLFHYLMEWQDGIEANPDVPIYTSVFEDVKRDPVGCVIKLNEFLGTGRSKELCEEIADACSFNKMKSHKESTAPEPMKQMFKSGQIGFYRKGDIGDWKNWFTVALNEKFDALYKTRMARYKRQYTFTV